MPVIGCAKDDIKKVLAGSTMSQIGYMMLAAGLGVAGYAFAIFHLLTHGFFKANMFLGAGSVMHGTNDDVDMRHYGALRKLMPVTFLTFAMGYLAIIGFPGFAGFWSKDKIIETALARTPGSASVRPARRRRHRLLHDPADADDLLRRGALGARTYTRTSRPKVMTDPADRARRAVGRSAACCCSTTGSSTSSRRSSATAPHEEPPLPALVISALVVLSWSPSASRIAWLLFGRRDVPRMAPPKVSVFTTGGRNDLYGDAFNDGGHRRPGKSFIEAWRSSTRASSTAASWARPALSAGSSGRLRLAQNGFVRSYALSLLGGAALVLLALLVVNLA